MYLMEECYHVSVKSMAHKREQGMQVVNIDSILLLVGIDIALVRPST